MRAPATTRSVEIAGGGIAGLASGLAFARRGWRVRVHEQDEQLRVLGAGIYIWENGLRILDALDVLPAVICDAIPGWRHEKRDHDGTFFAQSRISPRFRLYVPLRERLLTALYDGLIAAGGEVVFNSRAVAAEPEGVLHFADGREIRGDLVIGADGINSPVRDSRVPIDRALWRRTFPHLDGIIDRIPDEGRGDWFELVRVRSWFKGRVALIGDAVSGQPPFLGQGGGCAMMAAFTLAESIEQARDIDRGLDAWERRERPFTEWVQTVSYWYGQLAFLPAAARTSAFRLLDRSERLKAATLLVAARRDPTSAAYWLHPRPLGQSSDFPVFH